MAKAVVKEQEGLITGGPGLELGRGALGRAALGGSGAIDTLGSGRGHVRGLGILNLLLGSGFLAGHLCLVTINERTMLGNNVG